MVKIRLTRMGGKKAPYYRLVVIDSRKARNGRFIENIGHYDPMQEPPDIKVEKDRAYYWLSKGAQTSKTVKDILKKQDVLL